jgi:hypothetical protein
MLASSAGGDPESTATPAERGGQIRADALPGLRVVPRLSFFQSHCAHRLVSARGPLRRRSPSSTGWAYRYVRPPPSRRVFTCSTRATSHTTPTRLDTSAGPSAGTAIAANSSAHEVPQRARRNRPLLPKCRASLRREPDTGRLQQSPETARKPARPLRWRPRKGRDDRGVLEGRVWSAELELRNLTGIDAL